MSSRLNLESGCLPRGTICGLPIEQVRALHQTIDYSTAVHLHQEGIETLAKPGSDNQHMDHAVLSCLRMEAQKDCQVIKDAILANRIHGGAIVSQQMYENAEMAQEEQARSDKLQIQSAFDHQYAWSVEQSTCSRKRKRNKDDPHHPKTLFALCIEVCVRHQINVAEALDNGRVSVLKHPKPFIEDLDIVDKTTPDDSDISRKLRNETFASMKMLLGSAFPVSIRIVQDVCANCFEPLWMSLLIST